MGTVYKDIGFVSAFEFLKLMPNCQFGIKSLIIEFLVEHKYIKNES